MRKAVDLILCFFLIIPIVLTDGPVTAQLSSANPAASPQGEPMSTGKIAPRLETTLTSLEEEEMVSVIVTLTDQADLSRIPGASRAARLEGVIRALQALANASQQQIEAFLAARAAQGLVSRVETFWVFNGLSVTATPAVIQELAARDDVARITPDDIQIAPTQGESLAEPNLSVVNAPALWNLGLYGQEIVVASMDSGVDVAHADLTSRWRGGSNSWFDPYGEHPDTPTDLSGHGTRTMGVMVGGDAGGTSIGVAPGAQWIAAKIFDDRGDSTATAIHQAFQWLLDPDKDPATADAPHVVNNSWTFGYPGCDLEFELDLQALRAAGILSVFSAGNGGPYPETSYSPANNPSALAVGATDDSDSLYAYSSRGPSSCGEAESIFPELVAPGVGIRTTDLHGTYADATGTSLAAPHVAGGLALLLSAFPELTDAEQQDALTGTPVDLGATGPDNDFGYGRLDLLAAYEWLMEAPAPMPTPTATPEPAVNLALGQPVTVSSFEDDAHSGDAAVDGDSTTYWQTEKAVGKNKLPSEWITVDLGGSVSVGQVTLEWADHYATSYSIDISTDNTTWTTVFSTTAGDGGNDAIPFGPSSARYVRMESTAWSHDSRRNWLRELEVHGDGDSAPSPTPTPTATTTPTPTATPSPTSTPLPSPTPTPSTTTTMHVGDLDGSSSLERSRWSATVTITVLDVSGGPVSDASVDGTWTEGVSGSGSCVTDGGGVCSISETDIKKNVGSVVFTVEDVSHATMTYDPSANGDPDGDSDGTTITIVQP
jgi:subtilisin family serine protease